MSSIDQVSAAIGGLTNQSATLLRKAEENDRDMKDIKAKLEALKSSVASVEIDVAAFKPIATKVQTWEQRAIGMSLVGGLFGGGALSWFKGWF